MKILCLHGHTQTGPVFSRKTAALQAQIQQSYPDASFYFPTGPIKYKVSDRLDYLSDIQRERAPNWKDPDEIDTHAWFRLHEDDPPAGLLESIDMVAEILRTEGPFAGVICFSQGSVVGGMVASLLEGPHRRRRFEEYARQFPRAVQYPEPYKTLNHPPLKFGITYGAYMGVDPIFSAFYENPVIETPFMHFMGEFDPVVPSEMAAAVAKSQWGGVKRQRILHPGAHAIPIGKRYHEAVVDFISTHTAPANGYRDGYFGVGVGSGSGSGSGSGVPGLSYHDTPEETPVQTPELAPSIPATSSKLRSVGSLHRLRTGKTFQRRPTINLRQTRSRSFLSSRASSDSFSSSSQHSDTTETRTISPSPGKSESVVTVVEEDEMMAVPGYETADWQELMLSDLLNEMLRRSGRAGKFYFVPESGDGQRMEMDVGVGGGLRLD